MRPQRLCPHDGGAGGKAASESAPRSAGILLSRARAPPPAPPWPDGGSESLRSPCCGLAIYTTIYMVCCPSSYDKNICLLISSSLGSRLYPQPSIPLSHTGDNNDGDNDDDHDDDNHDDSDGDDSVELA
ncbi:hypothetical protein PoB_005383900 [Plakobranchus ocellatus]|uniref:Uncharacterized protein n=1 Tax=Plakobranchus ocellatus TaxID=259542 RepID=A0AAV4C462_9GAST|nr:hypothetical protein PoB_005383900 [Plakobranchus ocellatus]